MSAPEAQSTTICLARPEAVSPLSVAGRARLNRVCIRHPGYKSDPNNILLNLPAVDSYTCRHGDQIRRGLHHRTVLTAGAIIANNAFNRAHLAHDQAGNERVAAGLDDILDPGDYWLHVHLEHEEAPGPPAPSTGDLANLDAPMGPPPRSRGSSAYPVVPSFRDWRFPHGQLPSEWHSSHQPPTPPSPAPNSAFPVAAAPPPCCVTALRTGVERCHLVPQAGLLKEWFTSNAMAQYASDPARGIADMANMAVMRSDIHSMFDASRFAIVPKPSAGSSASTTASGGSSSYALAVHVLNEGFDELTPLYHNVAIQSSSAEVFSSEFLFARFALSLFPLVQSFIDSPAPRHMAVSKLDTSEDISKLAWMNGREFAQHREQRGESRNGSKKRGSSNISRDGQDPADVDSADCSRSPKRRNKRSNDYMQDLYLSGGQTEACAKFCDGQSPSSTDATEPLGLEGMEGCKWWRDEIAQPDNHVWEQDEMFRGRPRYRAPDSLFSAAPRDPPSLSCSSTSTASDGSSAVAWDSWVPQGLGNSRDGSGHKTLDPGGHDTEEQPS